MNAAAVPTTLVAAIALAFASNAAFAQVYPGKPLRLIVSSGPQGGTDTIARIAAATLSESLGQQVVVENRPGANGQIAVALVAKSPPDGYTLLMSGCLGLDPPEEMLDRTVLPWFGCAVQTVDDVRPH